MMNNKFLQAKWKIFVGIIVLWLLGTCALGFIAYTSSPPTGSSSLIETIKIIFLSLGGLGVVLPTYINAVNAIEARSTEKLENTFRLIEKWDDPLMFKARSFTRELKKRKERLSDVDLVAEIEGNSDLKQSVILLINYFDQIRVSEETGRIDAALFNRSLGPVMSDYHGRLRPYVKSMGEQNLPDWDKINDLSKIK